MRRLLRGSVFMLAFWTAASTAAAQTLRIYHIDVDQADATLIVAPGGKTLLVDSGRNGHGGRIRDVMAAAGVTRIDFFVATHYHEDHYGGIDEVVHAGVTVGTAYDRGDKAFLPASRLTSATYKGYDRAVGHRALHLTRGETIPLDPLMTVTCITSGGVVLGEQDPPVTGGDENDMSIGLLVTFGAFRYWVGGDVEEPTEAKIAARHLVQDLDLYQANHHGADNGSSAAFLDDIHPSVVVISNGSNAGFRHPRATTLARFAGLAPAPVVFQLNRYLLTGDDGANVADSLIADPETVDDDGTLLVTVDRPTGTFIVSYGQRTRTFAVKGVADTARLVIERLLPNPVTETDRMGETVTIRNTGRDAVDMSHWFLRDADGRVWALESLGAIAPGQRATARRNGMAMSLNNDGDTITLLGPTGRVVDSFNYATSQPGVEILTGH